MGEVCNLDATVGDYFELSFIKIESNLDASLCVTLFIYLFIL